MKKRIGCLLLSGMLIFLAGCGSSGSSATENAAAVASKEHVYKEEALNFDFGATEVGSIHVVGDRIYVEGYNYNEDPVKDAGVVSEETQVATESTTEATTEVTTESVVSETETVSTDVEADEAGKIAEATGGVVGEMYEGPAMTTERLFGVFEMDGTPVSTFSMKLDQNETANNLSIDSKGNLYTIVDEFKEDLTDPNNPVYQDNFYLVSLNDKGVENWRVSVNENVKLSADESFYVNSLLCDKEDNILLWTTKGLFVYKADSTLSTQIEAPQEEVESLVLLQDGTVAAICYTETGRYIKKIDLKTKTFSEAVTLPFNSYNYTFYTGFGYDLFLTDSYGVYGYNLGEESIHELMNFVDSDINTTSLYNITGISDKEIIANYYDEEGQATQTSKFTKVAPKDVKEKETLTMACYYLDSEVRNQVVKFNKASDTYRIHISDYSSYNTDEDYTIGVTKLNADIASGNIPDILMLNAELPVNSYISKGLLQDLNEFIEKDPDIKREDYLGNIFDAFSTNGKMYQLVPSFNVNTVIGKTADVGSERGWTLDDLKALSAAKGPDVAVFSETTKDTIMNYASWMCGEQFIDWETGKCSYDSESFIKLLEFANNFPAEIDQTIYNDDSYWEGYQSMFREGRTLLSMAYLSAFTDYNMQKKGTFGEDITLIGFPTDNKNGSAISYNNDFAISAKSKNKDAAWQFIRYFLTDEYQDTITYMWPVKIAQLDKLGEAAMKKPFYLDESGNKVEYEDTYNVNGVDVPITPMTQAEVDEVKTFLKSLDQVMEYNNELINIVTEESAAYFSGQKTAAEVAAIIQSRAQIYVNENM